MFAKYVPGMYLKDSDRQFLISFSQLESPHRHICEYLLRCNVDEINVIILNTLSSFKSIQIKLGMLISQLIFVRIFSKLSIKVSFIKVHSVQIISNLFNLQKIRKKKFCYYQAASIIRLCFG